jgi:hypothetical protein
MLRFVLSAMALAGILATMLPAFADPLPATAAGHARVTAAATAPPAPPDLVRDLEAAEFTIRRRKNRVAHPDRRRKETEG